MDATQIAVLPHPAPVTYRRSVMVISLAALLAAAFFVTVALPYLTLNPEVLARYGSRQVWVLMHIAAGGVALLTVRCSCGWASAAEPCECIGGSDSPMSSACAPKAAQCSQVWLRESSQCLLSS